MLGSSVSFPAFIANPIAIGHRFPLIFFLLLAFGIPTALPTIEPARASPRGDITYSVFNSHIDPPGIKADPLGQLFNRNILAVIVLHQVAVEPGLSKASIYFGSHLADRFIGSMGIEAGTLAAGITAAGLGGISALSHVIEPGKQKLKMLYRILDGAGSHPDEFALFIIFAHIRQSSEDASAFVS